MRTDWRISSINGALLAAYFIPSWTIIAWQIMAAPVQGLFERPNVAIAFFVSDYLHLAGPATVRVAWMLALGRLTAVAFFAVFTLLLFRPSIRRSGGCDEALGFALTLASLISFVSMVLASHAGEAEALRLHASELLMLLGAAILLIVERAALPLSERRAETGSPIFDVSAASESRPAPR
jgi:hypothetical protein